MLPRSAESTIAVAQAAPAANDSAIDARSAARRLGRRHYMLFLLFLAYTLTTVDRAILNVLLQPIKQDLGLSDTQAGFLVGIAFGLFFVIAGIPLGVLSDRWSRRNVVGLAVLAWSAVTAFCGTAASFLQMALGRVGVAVGEAGAPPAAVAMIADSFPENRRTRAIAIFYLGAPAGAFVTGAVMAAFAAHFGWRMAFFAAALPGLLLGLLMLFTVPEPRRHAHAETPRLPIRQGLSFILRQRSLCLAIFATTISHMVNTGVMVFIPAFLMRSYGMSLAKSGMMTALFNAITMAVALYAGGWLTDRLAQRDPLWRARVSTLSLILALVLLPFLALATSQLAVVCMIAVWTMCAVAHITPTLSLGQFLARRDIRATVSSVHFVMATGVGGLGPFLTGVLSDRYTPAFGVESLRYAFLTMGLLYLPSIWCFWRAEKTLIGDMKRATEEAR